MLERGREFGFGLELASVSSGSGPRPCRDRAKHAYTTEPRRAQGGCPAHFCSALHTLSEALPRADRTQSRCHFAQAGCLRGRGGCAGSRPQHRLRSMPSQSVASSWPQADSLSSKHLCPACGRPMGLTRTVPPSPGYSELRTYGCIECGVWVTEGSTLRDQRQDTFVVLK